MTATSLQPAACLSRHRHDWTRSEIQALLAQSLPNLIFQAQQVHRQYFDPAAVQLSTLMNIKSGGCPEDCAYCPQSARYDTGLNTDGLAALDNVLLAARNAKAAGATRFCMGAAWRSPKDRDLAKVETMVSEVKQLGLETCVTLGMLAPAQAKRLKDAGLDYYNHNIDTSPEHYGRIITTRTLQDRLETLEHVREAGIKVCCGGIIGLGEAVDDRAGMLMTLANLPEHPHSVPINMLVRVKGTPLGDASATDGFDLVRTIAAARITMPESHVRLSAGRSELNEAMQALCFLAGANSIFYGDELLTTANPAIEADRALLEKLGMHAEM
ncbi:MAG: biotin synthase BioB [Gammaproteobacteria bacterium]